MESSRWAILSTSKYPTLDGGILPMEIPPSWYTADIEPARPPARSGRCSNRHALIIMPLLLPYDTFLFLLRPVSVMGVAVCTYRAIRISSSLCPLLDIPFFFSTSPYIPFFFTIPGQLGYFRRKSGFLFFFLFFFSFFFSLWVSCFRLLLHDRETRSCFLLDGVATWHGREGKETGPGGSDPNDLDGKICLLLVSRRSGFFILVDFFFWILVYFYFNLVTFVVVFDLFVSASGTCSFFYTHIMCMACMNGRGNSELFTPTRERQGYEYKIYTYISPPSMTLPLCLCLYLLPRSCCQDYRRHCRCYSRYCPLHYRHGLACYHSNHSYHSHYYRCLSLLLHCCHDLHCCHYYHYSGTWALRRPIPLLPPPLPRQPTLLP
jgi:hypothetical protein